jgi:dTDP-4-dehydrorhamnose 3,5-epimerase-like enzyme
MEVIKTALDGVVIIEPKVFADSRGYFFESFSQREFDEKVAIPFIGKPIQFVQDNEICRRMVLCVVCIIKECHTLKASWCVV